MNTKRLLIAALGSTLFLTPGLGNARQNGGQENVVEASRKAQAAKKMAPKSKIVLDNDNLDTLKGVVNVVGQEPPPPEGQAKAAAEKPKVVVAMTDEKKPPANSEA